MPAREREREIVYALCGRLKHALSSFSSSLFESNYVWTIQTVFGSLPLAFAINFHSSNQHLSVLF